jgi:hypothetical protein
VPLLVGELVMNGRTYLFAAFVVIVIASMQDSEPTLAQACNQPPNRPSSVTAARSPDGDVLVTWTVSGGCAAERFYLEASRGTTEIIEETVEDGEERSVSLALGVGNATPWRIAVRGFNEFGLSPQRSAVLSESNAPAPENPCPSGTLPPPNLISANAVGRTLYVQWEPDARCAVALTHFVIGGSLTPEGPLLGSITVPYPNARSWSGEVPAGSYFVKVFSNYYTESSPASQAILVHVQ